jgi:cytochrome c
MLRRSLLLPVAMLAAIFASGVVAQQESATPEEVVQKVNQAAKHLAQKGEAGLEAFRTKSSEYVWKDSYVVVQDCEEGKSVAHPISPELEGRDIGTLTDQSGKAFAQELCEAAQQPHGGWVEYMWPKPGEQEPSRKVSYAKAVAGTPYIILAGIYDDDATVEELQQISRRQ